MSESRRTARATPVSTYAAVVIANYLAQVVYALHLYGTTFSRSGVLLLGATLVWFLIALVLYRAGRRSGFWLLLTYAAVEFLFYFNAEIVGTLVGAGLPYQLGRTDDLVVWLTFLVGDLNFIAAAWVLIYLVRHRSAVH
jgi:hypothetical protein